MSPQISCIIPVYNVAEFVSEAIASALQQQPPFKQVIIVDDGSTDGTREIVAGFKDQRIIYHYQTNQGLGPARNAGIKLADGDFLYFMDGDDVLTDGLTRFVTSAIVAGGDKLDAAFFSAVDFDHSSGKTLPSTKYFRWARPHTYETGKDALIASLANKNMPVCAFLYVFRKRLIDQEPALRFPATLHEDEAFTPNLMFRCGLTVISNEVFYRRRVRPNSIMTSPTSVRNIEGLMYAAHLWLELAGNAERTKSRHYILRANYLYCHALSQSFRAHLTTASFLAIVQNTCPEFRKFVMTDHALASISTRLARNFVKLRARIIAGTRWL